MPIIEILERLGLRNFSAPLALLMERVAGIEMALDTGEERVEAVLRQQLAKCSEQSAEASRVFVMQVCVGLPVFRYRAGAAKGPEVWQPLLESLRQFRERHGEVVFWQESDLRPSIPETLEWLRSWSC